MDDGFSGVKAGRRTIFKRRDQAEDSGTDLEQEVQVVDDFGANRGMSVMDDSLQRN